MNHISQTLGLSIAEKSSFAVALQIRAVYASSSFILMLSVAQVRSRRQRRRGLRIQKKRLPADRMPFAVAVDDVLIPRQSSSVLEIT